jgi:cell shape-determining protein MreC
MSYLAFRLLDEMEAEQKELAEENEKLVNEVIQLMLENIRLKQELYKANSNSPSSSGDKSK